MELAYFVSAVFIFNALFYSPVMADLPGGETNMDPNDPKYYALAQESLYKYEEQTGQRNLLVAAVTKATEQLVAGLIIRLHFTAKALDQNYLLMCNSQIFEPLDSSQNDFTVGCELP